MTCYGAQIMADKVGQTGANFGIRQVKFHVSITYMLTNLNLC